MINQQQIPPYAYIEPQYALKEVFVGVVEVKGERQLKTEYELYIDDSYIDTFESKKEIMERILQ